MTVTDLNPSEAIVKSCIAATVDCILDNAADTLALPSAQWGRYDRILTTQRLLNDSVQNAVRGTDASAWALLGQVQIAFAQAIDPTLVSISTDTAQAHARIYVLGERDKRKVVRALRRAARVYRSTH